MYISRRPVKELRFIFRRLNSEEKASVWLSLPRPQEPPSTDQSAVITITPHQAQLDGAETQGVQSQAAGCRRQLPWAESCRPLAKI